MTSNHRERCLKEKGVECSNCGYGSDIQVHHIDKDRENGDVDNLIPLCNACHWKLHRIDRASSDEIEHLRPELLDGWTPDDNNFRHPSLKVNQNQLDTLEYVKEHGPVKREEVINAVPYADRTVASAIVFLHGAGVIKRVRRGVYEYVPNPYDSSGVWLENQLAEEKPRENDDT